MTILEEATRITGGDRREAYGDPRENWERTAAIWSAILGAPVTAEQALMCMIGVKLAREAHRPQRDTRVDIAGYAEILDRISK